MHAHVQRLEPVFLATNNSQVFFSFECKHVVQLSVELKEGVSNAVSLGYGSAATQRLTLQLINWMMPRWATTPVLLYHFKVPTLQTKQPR